MNSIMIAERPSIAHEFRNALNLISMATAMIRRDPTPERIAMYLEKIERATERMTQLAAELSPAE